MKYILNQAMIMILQKHLLFMKIILFGKVKHFKSKVIFNLMLYIKKKSLAFMSVFAILQVSYNEMVAKWHGLRTNIWPNLNWNKKYVDDITENIDEHEYSEHAYHIDYHQISYCITN